MLSVEKGYIGNKWIKLIIHFFTTFQSVFAKSILTTETLDQTVNMPKRTIKRL